MRSIAPTVLHIGKPPPHPRTVPHSSLAPQSSRGMRLTGHWSALQLLLSVSTPVLCRGKRQKKIIIERS